MSDKFRKKIFLAWQARYFKITGKEKRETLTRFLLESCEPQNTPTHHRHREQMGEVLQSNASNKWIQHNLYTNLQSHPNFVVH